VSTTLDVCVKDIQGNNTPSQLLLMPANNSWNQRSGTSDSGMFQIKNIPAFDRYNIYAIDERQSVGKYLQNPFYLGQGDQALQPCIVIDGTKQFQSLKVVGQLVTDDGEPMPNTDIKLFEAFGDASSSVEVASVRSEPDGRFSFDIEHTDPLALSLVFSLTKSYELRNIQKTTSVSSVFHH